MSKIERQMNFEIFFLQTLCFVSISVTMGQNIPANVPTAFDIPMRILAYLGAMSK